MPSFKSTTSRQTNTSVATPQEHTLIAFVVATACIKVIPKIQARVVPPVPWRRRFARSDKRTRSLTAEQARNDIQLITTLPPGRNKRTARSRAILTFSALVGAMSLARAVSDEVLSREILKDRGGTFEEFRLEAS